ncbi:NAD(P)-dependent oxidoreductase [Streptomyces carminius]|uniref:NAD(P)-dependent oxidoreductase n=1 Tax=Streptomyces carminius TaxID=2665496 RepID=A0A2M8LS45_9ACTN|nr:NAD(P)H-binding protein [Streptomyces carminius]PJE94754.1 NAD(P)-dependent oxidoreductase [Streptomyces carminius]
MTTTPKTSDEILVLGATGKTGRRLVDVLRKQGRTVRAASRSGEVRFDWHDRETWPAALEGAAAVYLVAPDDPAPVRPFVEQAVEAGVRRFVALSGRGMDRIPEGAFAGMAAAEEAVRDCGVEWTVIRPNNFQQNFGEGDWLDPVRAGRLALPIGSAPEPFIDARDIAEVAAVLLTSDGHHGQVYDLSGPEALTFGAAVETIAAAAGRPIRYEELVPEEYRAELRAGGVPEEVVGDLDAMFAAMRAGHLAEPADGVRRVLGREPAGFGAYAARAAAAGAWS